MDSECSQTGNEDGSSLLIEGTSDRKHVLSITVPRTKDGGDTHSHATRGMDVGGHQLKRTIGSGHRSILTRTDFKVDADGGIGIQAAHVPAIGTILEP